MASSRPPRRLRLGLAILATWALALILVFLLFALAGCSAYNPSLFPGYDTLNPSEKVRVNPLSTFPDPVTGEQLFVVNSAFLLWVDELKQEVLKLRKGAK